MYIFRTSFATYIHIRIHFFLFIEYAFSKNIDSKRILAYTIITYTEMIR